VPIPESSGAEQLHPNTFMPHETISVKWAPNRDPPFLQQCKGAASSTASLRSSRISPLVYNSKYRTHRKIFEDARGAFVRNSLRLQTGPFLTENERKSAAQEALLWAANQIDDGKLHYLQFLNVSETSTRVRESVERRKSYSNDGLSVRLLKVA
jgi:hypothetical protein